MKGGGEESVSLSLFGDPGTCYSTPENCRISEMPTSGHLKSGDFFFVPTPPPTFRKIDPGRQVSVSIHGRLDERWMETQPGTVTCILDLGKI